MLPTLALLQYHCNSQAIFWGDILYTTVVAEHLNETAQLHNTRKSVNAVTQKIVKIVTIHA